MPATRLLSIHSKHQHHSPVHSLLTEFSRALPTYQASAAKAETCLMAVSHPVRHQGTSLHKSQPVKELLCPAVTCRFLPRRLITQDARTAAKQELATEYSRRSRKEADRRLDKEPCPAPNQHLRKQASEATLETVSSSASLGLQGAQSCPFNRRGGLCTLSGDSALHSSPLQKSRCLHRLPSVRATGALQKAPQVQRGLCQAYIKATSLVHVGIFSSEAPKSAGQMS